MSCYCENCGKQTQDGCSGCRQVYYCGSECQNLHWPEHQDFCFDEIQSTIDDLLEDEISIDDTIDEDFVELGENLVDADLYNNPELLDLSLAWIEARSKKKKKKKKKKKNPKKKKKKKKTLSKDERLKRKQKRALRAQQRFSEKAAKKGGEAAGYEGKRKKGIIKKLPAKAKGVLYKGKAAIHSYKEKTI